MTDAPEPFRRPRSVRLPEREALVLGETDVLVIGGGPAGLGAAVGAARAGAEVILAERHGFLGGNATAALVMPLMSYHTQRGAPLQPSSRSMMPLDHGPGEPVVAGVLAELVERMREMGGAIAPSTETGYTVPFDPDSLEAAAHDLLAEAGVDLLLHSLASGVVEPPVDPVRLEPAPAGRRASARVGGVVFETKSGPTVVYARTVIDCTGDGDIAALAEAPFEMGRPDDTLTQPMTLMFRLAGVEPSRFQTYVDEHPGQWRGVHGLWNLVEEASRTGELDLPREDILLFAGVRETEVSVNSTRVAGSGVDVLDLTRAEIVARRQMRQIVEFLRRRVPGFEGSRLLQRAATVGVRETRRIVGEYRLEADDVMSARSFDDVIARCAYPIDIHDPAGTGTFLERLPEGESYDIPLRCLVPRDVEGLLVAGRCISGSHEAHSSYRVMPVSVATGQAAGVCGAISSLRGRPPRDVGACCVQAELLRQGASLGDRQWEDLLPCLGEDACLGCDAA